MAATHTRPTDRNDALRATAAGQCNTHSRKSSVVHNRRGRFPLLPIRCSVDPATTHCPIDKDRLTSPYRHAPVEWTERGKPATGIGAQSFRFAPRPEPRAWAEFRVSSRRSREPAGISIQSWQDKGRSSTHLNPSGDATGPHGSPVRRSRPQCPSKTLGSRARALCERKPVVLNCCRVSTATSLQDAVLAVDALTDSNADLSS